MKKRFFLSKDIQNNDVGAIIIAVGTIIAAYINKKC